MAITLNQLNGWIVDRVEDINDGIARKMRAAGRGALDRIVDKTPVNEGVARSNYQVTFGRPAIGVRPAFSPGINLGINEQANASAVKQLGFSIISRFQPRRDRSIFITNNTPYIETLNAGSSNQNPAGGFLQEAALVAVVSSARIRLLN